MAAPTHRVDDLEARLDTMIARTIRDRWAPETAIDWARPARPPKWLPRRLSRAMVSQLYHGEEATGAACRDLAALVPDAGARRFLLLQAEDEARHAAAYARYAALFGGIAAPDPYLSRAFRAALSWDGPWQAKMVAAHLVIEGDAVHLLRESRRAFACPLLAEINRLVARDEGRHLAFGKMYLRATLGTLPAAERRRIYAWIFELWHTSVVRRRDAVGLLARVKRGGLQRRWDTHNAAMGAVGLIARADFRPLGAVAA